MINAVNQNANAQAAAQNQAVQSVAGAAVQNDNNATTEQTQENAPKYCSNCGAKLTGRFCSNCGKEAK